MSEESRSWVPLSLPRAWMTELAQLARAVPTATVHRRMRLGRLAAARELSWPRPGWCAMFVKAYALLAQRRPELRRIYLPWPWPHLYEHPVNVASIAVARTIGDEDAVFFARMESPESLGLWDIERHVQHCREGLVESIPEFGQLIRWARLPWPARRVLGWAAHRVSGQWHAEHFGTFGVSTVAGHDALTLAAPSPWTVGLHYGPLGSDGGLDVCLTYDLRVRDAVSVARSLGELEDVLTGEIVNELGYMRDLEVAA
ncbi:hypothetical protein AYO44_13645 [Planctomycetaceae bacterium SCGC AG-212-F19]|nr:hypothetical protein AYO44_13645 [Planctomycetaceae bacterium SCGC AG-212-F19]